MLLIIFQHIYINNHHRAVVQLLALIIYPNFIQPLFNKFTPLEEGELKKQIEDIASSVNYPLKKLFVVDNSKRSGHSNAYLFGYEILIYKNYIYY